MIKAISFFSGAGGLDIGISNVGFDILMSLEIEKRYCETLKENNPNFNVINEDIMNYNRSSIYEELNIKNDDEIGLIFGGCPCQSFSTAGRRQAFSDPRGKAMLKFADIVSEVKPRAFLLENVKGLLSASLKHRPIKERGKDYPPLSEDEEKGSAFKYLLSYFKDYDIKYDIINSAEYGVPQRRERVFIVGIRKDLNKSFSFPEPTHSEDGKNGKKKFKTFTDVMRKLENVQHSYVTYSDVRLDYMKLIPKGGGYWRDLPDNLIKEAMGGAYKSGGGKTGYFRRIRSDKPSPTLLTSPIQKSTNIGHPYEDRPLSIEEYLEIQGFPTNYQISGSMTHKYTQIGNAVPITIGEVIGEKLLETIK